MCGINRDEEEGKTTAITDIKVDPSFDMIVGDVISEAAIEEGEPDANVTAVVDELEAALTTEDAGPPPPPSSGN